MGTTTGTESKVVNGVFKKRKPEVRLCVMVNQQEKEVHYQQGELYAPVMKAAEVRLFMANSGQVRAQLIQFRHKAGIP